MHNQSRIPLLRDSIIWERPTESKLILWSEVPKILDLIINQFLREKIYIWQRNSHFFNEIHSRYQNNNF